MFARRYFGARYFAPRYFGDGGDQPPPVEQIPTGGGWYPPPRRKPRRSREEIERERDERWLAQQRKERDLELELAGIYDRLHGLTLPPEQAESVAAEVAIAVAPFVEAADAAPMRVDWQALAADVDAVRTMLGVAKRLRLDRQRAEDDRLLTILLLAS